MWYKFEAYNSETLFGWTQDERVAKAYSCLINVDRRVNVYSMTELSEAEAAELDLESRNDLVFDDDTTVEDEMFYQLQDDTALSSTMKEMFSTQIGCVTYQQLISERWLPFENTRLNYAVAGDEHGEVICRSELTDHKWSGSKEELVAKEVAHALEFLAELEPRGA